MIFREMRQKKQELSRQEIADILHKGTSGVLALLGDNDYPYAVPISYVYDDGKIYFHGAKNGHKIDAIQRTAKASFCVIDKDLVVPEEYTNYFRSVIAFGQIRIIEGDLEKRAAIVMPSAMATLCYPSCRSAFNGQGLVRIFVYWRPQQT